MSTEAEKLSSAIAVSFGLKLAVCAYGCGKAVMWAPIHDRNGRPKISGRTGKPSMILLDVIPTDKGTFTVITGGGAVTSVRRNSAARLLRSHFETCPKDPRRARDQRR